MTFPRIDLVVFHNFFADQNDTFDDSFGKLAAILGVEYSVKNFGETKLKQDPQDRELFPEQGLIYVHGSMLRSYDSLDRVFEIAPQRPDLRWMVQVDDNAQSWRFSSQERYEWCRSLPCLWEVRNNIENVRNAPIVKNLDDTYVILAPPGTREPTDFQQYLSLLLESRRGAQ